MKIFILTLFPEMFRGPFDQSIIARARQKGTVTIETINIRDFATDKYRSVDDHPYGGGVGMILRVDVVDRALRHAKSQISKPNDQTRIILLDAQGIPYTQKKARELSKFDHLILLCGHYEGIDERIRTLVDEEISIGDYVLTGGELPTMVLVDSLVRLLPGTLSKSEATVNESFSGDTGLLEYPQYTRPEEYQKLRVPEVLLSGNHQQINLWRQAQSKLRTQKRRPELLSQKSHKPIKEKTDHF